MENIIGADAVDLTGLVKAGDTVIWSQGPSEPRPLTEALVSQRHLIGRFTAVVGSSFTKTLHSDHVDYIDFIGLGGVGATRKLVDAGVLQIIPCHVSQFASLMRSGELKIDVAFVQVAPRENDGYSYGSVCSYMPDAIRNARLVIAEINDQAPTTASLELLDPSRIDYCINTSQPLLEVPSRDPSEAEVQIARYVAGLVDNGAILQIGIGTLPNAILSTLKDHRHLGLHSGVVGDGVIDLIQRGVIDNSSKGPDRGISVTGSLFGSTLLTKFAHRNNEIRVDPMSYTHDIRVLAGSKSFTTINSAIEVDLFGQVNNEIADGKYVGTIGGQVDFARGAQVSPFGKSIIAIPARLAERGQRRIVSRLSSPVVSTARSDTDFVVTEFGIAALRGKTVMERARALISVAHPDDRESLEKEWFEIRR